MAWVTPITDRTQSDIVARNSKAFFNVADWQRIYDDTQYVANQVASLLGISVTLTSLSTPTITTIPAVADINTLIANVETVKAAILGYYALTGTNVLKTDWAVGVDQPSPNYVIVNLWENNLDVMHAWLTASLALTRRFARTGVAPTGAGMTRQNLWRAY
jgi:hypothetical protein